MVAAIREAACDLRFGQVGVATLKLRHLDIQAVREEMTAKLRAAPQLLARAPVIVDLNAFSDLPDAGTVQAVLAALRDVGVLPVGLAYGSQAVDALARELGLPLFARFRANFDDAAPAQPAAPEPVRETAQEPAIAPLAPAANGSGRLIDGHVRSGQQIYARGQDLTVLGSVGAGAEVIADGNIHIYGTLRGRALAGAAGDVRARVFCREFQAELVAVAGHYRVLEDAPPELRGRALHIRLDGERLLFEPL